MVLFQSFLEDLDDLLAIARDDRISANDFRAQYEMLQRLTPVPVPRLKARKAEEMIKQLERKESYSPFRLKSEIRGASLAPDGTQYSPQLSPHQPRATSLSPVRSYTRGPPLPVPADSAAITNTGEGGMWDLSAQLHQGQAAATRPQYVRSRSVEDVSAPEVLRTAQCATSLVHAADPPSHVPF